ncbi:YceI family protein [Streptomyces sp. NBC_01257]|uniref:YceI family protein n=1 Tax=Streptomyces sp. NBC_01257 TaxID=2903799 RepID=UPI002DD9243A|nr:YceI family protein [Streptomyces sp. NBC_01257]WRZ69250.1 YceI family protein [Streptomyces sp. NBC_01257]
MSTAPATAAIPGYLAGTWRADPDRCEVAFSLRYLTFGTARGRFTGCDATIVTREEPRASAVTATVDVASIDTGNEKRDKHLRSADYLDAENHPTMSYRSTGIRRSADGWTVDGELTLHGVTRQVPLAVEPDGFGPGPSGGQQAGFTATARIDRRDFGITARTDGGGVLVGNKVSIRLLVRAALVR